MQPRLSRTETSMHSMSKRLYRCTDINVHIYLYLHMYISDIYMHVYKRKICIRCLSATHLHGIPYNLFSDTLPPFWAASQLEYPEARSLKQDHRIKSMVQGHVGPQAYIRSQQRVVEGLVGPLLGVDCSRRAGGGGEGGSKERMPVVQVLSSKSQLAFNSNKQSGICPSDVEALQP